MFLVMTYLVVEGNFRVLTLLYSLYLTQDTSSYTGVGMTVEIIDPIQKMSYFAQSTAGDPITIDPHYYSLNEIRPSCPVNPFQLTFETQVVEPQKPDQELNKAESLYY